MFLILSRNYYKKKLETFSDFFISLEIVQISNVFFVFFFTFLM